MDTKKVTFPDAKDLSIVRIDGSAYLGVVAGEILEDSVCYDSFANYVGCYNVGDIADRKIIGDKMVRNLLAKEVMEYEIAVSVMEQAKIRAPGDMENKLFCKMMTEL